jgi:hypothetical protein
MVLDEFRRDTPFHCRIYALLFADFLLIVWVRLVICNLRPGKQRLLAATPVLATTCMLPLFFAHDTEVVTTVAVAFVHVWLTNFKVLGLALDRGPLTLPLSALQFATVLLAPITPQIDGKMHRVGSVGRLADSCGTASEMLGRFAAKTAGLCCVVFGLAVFDPPRVVQEILYALGLYAFLGFFMDGPATAITSLMGLKIAPHFNQPYISSSVSSFWGARWNLTAANTLRFMVYDTICDGRLVARRNNGPPARAPQSTSTQLRALAMMACFVVSGLVHELMFWYCQGSTTGLWLAFFSLQGPVILIEMVVQRLIRKSGWQVPKWARVAVTLYVLMGLGHLFFFPPPVQSGLADRVTGSIKESFSALFERLMQHTK